MFLSSQMAEKGRPAAGAAPSGWLLGGAMGLETLDLQVLDDEGAGGLRHAVLLVAAELEVALDPDAVARADELREALPVVVAATARDGLAALLGADGDPEVPDLAVEGRELALHDVVDDRVIDLLPDLLAGDGVGLRVRADVAVEGDRGLAGHLSLSFRVGSVRHGPVEPEGNKPGRQGRAQRAGGLALRPGAPRAGLPGRWTGPAKGERKMTSKTAIACGRRSGAGTRWKRRGPLLDGRPGEHDAPEETRGSRGAWVGASMERRARDVTAAVGWRGARSPKPRRRRR